MKLTAFPLRQVPGSTNYKKDIIEPAILGTTGILDAALKVSSIKRVVITSSMAAFLDMEYFMTPEPTRIYTGMFHAAVAYH